MKLNILSFVLAALILTGCESKTIQYKDVPYAVYVVPAPPAHKRPVLETEKLTPQQRLDAGEVLRAERASSIQKNGYILQLETILDKYMDLAKVSEDNLQRLTGKDAENLDSKTNEEWKKTLTPVPVKPVTDEDK